MMNSTLQYVKELRNSCSTTQSIACEDLSNVTNLSLSAAASIANSETDTEKVTLLATCMQFLSNCSMKNTSLQKESWNLFYPHVFLAVSQASENSVLEPFCYALWNFLGSGFWTLEREDDDHILKNLIEYYGSEAELELPTTFSLLLGRVLKVKDMFCSGPAADSELLSAISKADIEALNCDGVILSIVPLLFERAKELKSYSSLSALRNCISRSDVNLDLHKDITKWALCVLDSVLQGLAMENGCVSSLVATIANLVHSNQPCQTVVMESNGLEIVLNHIKLDERNPFIREWALLFLRNMCVNNEQARQFLANLDLKEVSTDEELGLLIEFDKTSGKFTICKRD